ncbi:hypothetical protein HYS49_02990 [Candidatus Woesearchaeota archaeon]|nr:hypothetical protein [Candidatus Woesearchaeota archaeon]
MPYLAIVVLVAVVAVVVLVLNFRPSSEEAVAGEATRLQQTLSLNSCSGWRSHCAQLGLGETISYSVKGKNYKVTVTNLQDYAPQSAKFTVNGEQVTLAVGATHTLIDGRWMELNEIVTQEFAGGSLQAAFCFQG